MKDKATKAWAALVAQGICDAAPPENETETVGPDGYVVGTCDAVKRESERTYAKEQDELKREAEINGDRAQAAFYAKQACEARTYATSLAVKDTLRARSSRARAVPEKRPSPRGAGRPKGRSAARRSSERSGDSGSAEGGESEPPQGGRPCICGCGRDVSHKRAGALYSDPEACRKRYQRERDRANPDRVNERDAKPDPRLRCGGCGEGAYPFDHRWWCLKCGRAIPRAYTDVNGHLAEREVLDVIAADSHRGTHKPRLAREWKTRPTRELSAKLRKTRKDWKVSA